VLPFGASHGWDTVYELARRIAEAVAQCQPEMFTTDFAALERISVLPERDKTSTTHGCSNACGRR
jgi:DNA primase